MVRSVWKGKSLSSGKILKNNKVWKRNIKILSSNVGQLYQVHNGLKFVEILVEENMVGKAFGDFVMTRRMGVDIHIKKRKKRNG